MIQWGKDLVERSKAKRNWKALPSDFERDAVRFAFEHIKLHFGRNEIKSRIAASRATTFEELQEAISS